MKSKILIIYTGGTIGMINDHQTGELKSFDFQHIFESVPELKRLNVELSALSFEQPVDSSEMNPTMWAKMATMVAENYTHYDGFVILHGSDTMSYSASALSFMLQGLQKPVIFTGSQLPIGTIRTDGKENLITAIEIAADKDPQNGEAIVQEVAVYFEYSLYRGNRSSKISANQFEAFESPNYPRLAIAGVSIEYRTNLLYRSEGQLELHTNFDSRVALLKLYPGINASIYSSLFDVDKNKAVIIESFGSGNAPSNELFRSQIESYIAAGGIVLNITQCGSGFVQQGKYETSSFFSKAGVISGNDLTTEAALAKMMYLLGTGMEREQILEKLQVSLCGELSF